MEHFTTSFFFPRKQFQKEFSLWQLIPKELKDVPVAFINKAIPFYKILFTGLCSCVYSRQKNMYVNNILLKVVLFVS
ncbi:hypothetical protein HIE71_003702 [Escherichia coli]|nr:hypothetical protein [Escherichia coli]EFH9260962.1 hypothetical protein [Escherichia coli]EFI9733643.1 hypothetical protein [Escherichia coli]HAH2562623.1 hypothetical protein [Escherichia coli]HAH2577054.1 hypothetical protein [Escherichia coli]